MEPLLRVEQLSKHFPQVVANDRITFDISPGEIHCLLGENGAGKSTLAECLYGFYKPDAGQIYFRGEPVRLSSPVDAIKLSVQAQGQGYHTTWLGGGTWWNYNMVLESAGMALDGAVVLSPWASIDSAATDEFKQVMRMYAAVITPVVIGLIMWGWANLVRAAMVQAGPQLSRDSFVRALNTLKWSSPTGYRLRTRRPAIGVPIR